MSEWGRTPLADLVEVHNKRRIPLSKRVRARRQGPYRYFGAQGVIDHLDDYLFDGSYLLVAEDGENLQSRKEPIARQVHGKFWVNNHAHIVSARAERADQTFLAHALNSSAFTGRITGAAQPKLTKANLVAHEIPAPPLRIQRRIAAVLSAFDDFIEINERRMELLENLARSLYHEWFVQLRFPGNDGARNAASAGGLPPGWKGSRLGAVAELAYGKSLSAKRRVPGPAAVVSSAGPIATHDKALVRGPGIVVGRKGNVGSVWWIDHDFFPIDTTYYVKSDLPLGFLYWQLRDMEFIDSHAAVPGLSREQAYSLPVTVPDPCLVQRFNDVHTTMHARMESLRTQNRALAATRDLLLPRLVTGRLDIDDIDLGDLLSEPAAAA